MSMLEIDKAMRLALDGQAVLFVGAGSSRSAISVAGESLKTGRELATFLAGEIEIPSESVSLEDVAEFYIQDRSENELVDLLRAQFQVRELSQEQGVFGRIPWRRIYTTNYDDTIELAHKNAGSPIASLCLDDPVKLVASSQAQCVHINGYIGTLAPEKLFNSFKLTDTSYASSSLEDSPWSQQLRHDFSIAKAIFFVGYSVYDLDVKRILAGIPSLQAKTLMFVGSAASILDERKLSKFGQVIREDVLSISKKFKAEEASYSPTTVSSLLGRVVYEKPVPPASAHATDQDVTDLFLWGRVQYPLVWSAVSEASYRYVCPRHQLEKALELLDKGEKNLIIRSDLGNGKTVFLDSLDCQARSFGFRVLRLDTLSEEFEAEIEEAAMAPSKTLLLVDSYTNKRRALEIVGTNRSPNLHVVCAARSIRHDVSYRWLYGALGVSDIPEIDLEVLKPEELNWFRETMDQHGLWGDFASASSERKERVLREKCRSRVSSILLRILSSETIAKRLNLVVSRLSKNKEFAETVAGVLILSVLDYAPSLELAADLLGTSVLNQSPFQRDEAVRETIDVGYDKVAVRSTVVAQHILANALDKEISLSALVRLANRANELAGKEFFFEIFKDLMRSANVHRVFPGAPSLVVRYYEHVRTLSGAKNNTNFWLQYAIAYMAMQRFPEARLKLDTAYSLGGDCYNTFMLDTANARLTLEECCETPKTDRDSAIAAFRKARKLLNHVLADKESMFQPFRAASMYKEFFVRHEQLFESSDRKEFLNVARFIIKRIDSLEPDRRNQRHTRSCREDMESLLLLASENPPTV